MQTNNQYYKLICENMGITVDSGVHNNNYYLKKIAVEGYGLNYAGTVCNGILIKDIAEQITGNTYTGHHFNNFYLKDIASALTGEDYNKQFDNYYLNIWADNVVRRQETNLSWTPPTNLVYSDEFNATGVLTCNNQPLEGKTVYLMIGSYIAGTGVTNSEGRVSFTATPVHSGRHTFSLVFKGDVEYSSCENSATIDVSKETSFLNMTNKNTFYTNEDVVLTGVLLDDEQEPIVGKYVQPYGVTDSNGVFSTNLGRANAGTYTFPDISFNDDDYTGNTISHTIQVVEPYLDLEADKSILSYEDGDTATLTATVHNKTVSGVTVTFYDENNNVIGTGTTDNTGVAVCNNRYESQGIGDVTLRAEATVDGIFVSEIFVVQDCNYYNTAEVTRSSTNGSTIYDNSLSQSLPSKCEISFDLYSDNSTDSGEHRFFLLPKSQYSSGTTQPTNAIYVDTVKTKMYIGKRESSTVSLYPNLSYGSGVYRNFKIIKDGNDLTFYIDDNLIGTSTISWIGNHSDYCLSMMRWSTSGTSKIKNVKFKPL